MFLKLKDSDLDFENMREISYESDSKIKLEKLREGLKIPIISDGMFKTLFQREDCIKYPCKLLSYIVNLSYEDLLCHMSFDKTETDKEGDSSYSYRQDLVVTIDNAKIVVEMNNNDTEKVRQRNLSYMMRIREDRKEKDTYRQTILVNLNNYCYKGDNRIRRDFALSDHTGVLYTDSLLIVDIYLPNIKKKCYTKGIKALSEMERFLLAGVEQDIESANTLIGEDLVMEEFVKENEKRSYDDDLRESYDKEEALKDQAFRDGIREGEERGNRARNIEIALEMLKEKEGIGLIEKYAHLSKEEIEEIARGEKLEIYDNLGESYDKEEALKDQVFRDGIREGQERGKEEGIRARNIEIALEMLKEKESIGLIEKYTHLSKEEIEKIARGEKLEIYDKK